MQRKTGGSGWQEGSRTQGGAAVVMSLFFFAIFHLQDMGISFGKSTSKILDPVIFVQKKMERAISRDQLWTVMDSIQNKCPMFREASARGAPPGDPNKERLLYMLTCQELS
jgi:hypothetical protein